LVELYYAHHIVSRTILLVLVPVKLIAGIAQTMMSMMKFYLHSYRSN
jgi:hypothetical protein